MQRNTRQRTAIRKVIEKARRPLSVEEIHAEAVRSVPGLGIATVYRAIRAFQQTGEITAISCNGEYTFYERSGKPHHHHFFCRCCHAMYDLDGCIGNVNSLAPAAFEVEHHDITLFGTCPDCR